VDVEDPLPNSLDVRLGSDEERQRDAECEERTSEQGESRKASK
jgi:hypothetical protein